MRHCPSGSIALVTIKASSPAGYNVGQAKNKSQVSSGATDLAAVSGLPELWAESLGDSRVLVAVLDGPVDLAHPCFAGANLTQVETLASDASSACGPAAMHGTHVASVIFGQHNSPVKGIAPKCRGLIMPVYRDGEGGSVIPCSQVHLAWTINEAIRIAEKEQADALVINISGGQFTPSGEAHPTLDNAVLSRGKNAGYSYDSNKVLIVAATGNQGCECLHIPAAIRSVLAVGAMNLLGVPLEFSNWGELYSEQGILAPGENILGASPHGGTTLNSGTSFATPIVSGVAALLLSILIKRGKNESAQAVGQGILKSALGCEHQQVDDCRRLLAGRLNIPGTISILTQGDLNMSEDAVSTDEKALDGHTERNLGFDPLLPSNTSVAEAEIEASIAPSGCGCGSATAPRQVFAIGNLTYGFATASARESMQDRIADGVVEDPVALIRHLLRQRGREDDAARVNLQEASRVLWLLEYGGVPQYAIQASGVIPGVDLESLFFDFMEQHGLATNERELRLEAPLDQVLRPDYFAIPGLSSGKLVTVEGSRPVPILYVEYDLVDTWNLDAVIADAIENGLIDKDDDRRISDARRMASAIYSFINPKGDSPEARAINYLASVAVGFATEEKFAQGQIALRGFSPPVRVESRREEDVILEIVAQFYDITNVNHALFHTRYRVDVTEPKPRLISQSQLGFGPGGFI